MSNAFTEIGQYLMSDRRIGKGRYFETFYGFTSDNNNKTYQEVAIKRLRKPILQNDVAKSQKLTKEQNILNKCNLQIENLKKVESQYVAKYLDFIETEEFIYIIQEYCNGVSLAIMALNSEQKADMAFQTQPSNQLQKNLLILFEHIKFVDLEFIHQVFKALIYAFEKLHRHDIAVNHYLLSPSQIMLHDGAIKLTDYGLKPLFTMIDRMEEIVSGPLLPEIDFVPLEALQGKPYDSKFDVYSFGVIIYKLLYNRHPYFDFSFMQTVSYNKMQIIQTLLDIQETSQPLRLLEFNEYATKTHKPIKKYFANFLPKMLELDETARISMSELIFAVSREIKMEEDMMLRESMKEAESFSLSITQTQANQQKTKTQNQNQNQIVNTENQEYKKLDDYMQQQKKYKNRLQQILDNIPKIEQPQTHEKTEHFNLEQMKQIQTKSQEVFQVSTQDSTLQGTAKFENNDKLIEELMSSPQAQAFLNQEASIYLDSETASDLSITSLVNQVVNYFLFERGLVQASFAILRYVLSSQILNDLLMLESNQIGQNSSSQTPNEPQLFLNLLAAIAEQAWLRWARLQAIFSLKDNSRPSQLPCITADSQWKTFSEVKTIDGQMIIQIIQRQIEQDTSHNEFLNLAKKNDKVAQLYSSQQFDNLLKLLNQTSTVFASRVTHFTNSFKAADFIKVSGQLTSGLCKFMNKYLNSDGQVFLQQEVKAVLIFAKFAFILLNPYNLAENDPERIQQLLLTAIKQPQEKLLREIQDLNNRFRELDSQNDIFTAQE